MGRPQWAFDEALRDPLERSRRGAEINRHLRAWAKTQRVQDVVNKGQALGVPVAKYNAPSDILDSEQSKARGLFAPVDLPEHGTVPFFSAPFQLDGQAPKPTRAAAEPGADNEAIWCTLLGHARAEMEQWRRHGAV
jgi:crotonobetainyl-CoA:carnitine CoA-transferase CaiB-like acyl-CoA transferase